MQIILFFFNFLWDHWAHPGYLENQAGGDGGGGGGGWGGGGGAGGGVRIYSLANYTAVYKETY